ncbi:MAG: hypothetical protein METHP_01872 [Methanoregula sp. SKADARSKE-2]|nr:MAG: hypothetical protein METHP_01872 [Methanoregula sp. SKADARSKE-2]
MDPAKPPMYHAVSLDRGGLAGRALDRYAAGKGARQSFSPAQKSLIMEDLRTRIRYLQEALALESAAIFTDYTRWARVYFAEEKLPGNYLRRTLAALDEIVSEELPSELAARAHTIIRESILDLESGPALVPSFLSPDNPHSATAQAYLDALLIPDRGRARDIISGALESEIPVKEIYLGIFQPVLRETGRLWQLRKISVAEEHFVTASVQLSVSYLHDRIIPPDKTRQGGKTLVAACVESELHEVGIRMVTDFFEIDGWNTYYIGANTPAQSLIQAARDRNADVVAISSTLPYDITFVRYIIRSLRADPVAKKAKVIVGGYTFGIVPDLWQRVGADAFARDAGEAVAAADRLIGE